MRNTGPSPKPASGVLSLRCGTAARPPEPAGHALSSEAGGECLWEDERQTHGLSEDDSKAAAKLMFRQGGCGKYL